MKRTHGRLRRVIAIAWLETLHLLRDRATLSLILVVPAFQILLFGYTVNLDPREVALAIASDPIAPTGRWIAAAVDATGAFRTVAAGLGPGEAVRMVERHEALVGIESAGLDEQRLGDGRAVPRIVVDACDPSAVRPAVLGLQVALARRSGTESATAAQVQWLYNPDLRTSWTIAPGLAGVVVMITMLMLGALTLVRERERGTWEGLLATPVSAAEAMLGKLSPYLLLAVLQAAVVIQIAHALFGLPVRGNLVLLLGAAAVLAAAHLITGFALSALARTQVQAIQAAIFFYLPSMLLSGFMFPFTGMPRWAQAIGEALPLTHFVRAARGVLLRADGIDRVAIEMLPAALYTVLMTGLALVAYRRRLD